MTVQVKVAKPIDAAARSLSVSTSCGARLAAREGLHAVPPSVVGAAKEHDKHFARVEAREAPITASVPKAQERARAERARRRAGAARPSGGGGGGLAYESFILLFV